MNRIKNFRNYFLTESSRDSSDMATRELFSKAFQNAFDNVKIIYGYGNQERIYDYSNGYVEHPITCEAVSWDCVDPKAASILESANFNPLTTKAYFFVYMPISDSKPKPPKAWIGLSGDKYLHNVYKFPTEISTGKFDTAIDNFKESSKKAGFNEDMLQQLFSMWKKSTYETSHKNTKNWGRGSQAVTYITKEFKSSYIIKNIDVALNMKREDIEKFVSSHYMFKKDDLKFDWDGGVMYVNGEFGEYWD